MSPLILALFAAAAAVAPPSAPPTEAATVVSGLIVRGEADKPPVDATIRIEGDDSARGQAVSVWPAAAYRAKLDGHVLLRCNIDVHGLAEWCRVVSEMPKNKGFGGAALHLRPTFQLTPAKGPDGAPMERVMTIAVEFHAPDTDIDLHNLTVSGNPLEMKDVTMLNHPIWVAAPSFEDMARLYPAKAAGVDGYAVAHCQVLKTGALNHCVISRETPVNLGFKQAAVKLAEMFKVAPEWAQAPHMTPIYVDVPIRFAPPAAEPDRVVTKADWLSGFDPKTALKVFPPEAAEHGLTSGRGVVTCKVGADGLLTACRPEPGEPDGQGFSEAAAKLAATMKMNLWSNDAQPVSGGSVRIAIRLKLGG